MERRGPVPWPRLIVVVKSGDFFRFLINHGISELLDRVKKVATECYKLEREDDFKNSKPVQLLNELLENKR
ncbi:UNVERIFIED_CONTAM: 1-aminocyclopropane-1-carboxylate oxidase 5 [Sesamum angustifolium]|uniref:1-aminocyclopropane-1-carboxylate oxidase 5 n=1 Tax=Sesamum angustifolium TaxID=2727405 RepID=A0AAW2INS3_9LAMI